MTRKENPPPVVPPHDKVEPSSAYDLLCTPVSNSALGTAPVETDQPLTKGIVRLFGDIVGTPRDIRHITDFGMVNSVFRIAGENGGNFIVRSFPGDQGVLDYEKEDWSMRKAAGCGVPVSTVRGIGYHDGHSYMIQDLLPGVNGASISDPAGRLAIWRQLGNFSSLLGDVRCSGYGWSLNKDSERFSCESWSAFIAQAEAQALGDPSMNAGVFTRAQREKLRGLFEILANMDPQPVLCHGDIGPSNCIVDPETLKINGIIDWEMAVAAPGAHASLVSASTYFKRPEEQAAFLEGMGQPTFLQDPQTQAEFRALRVLFVLYFAAYNLGNRDAVNGAQRRVAGAIEEARI